MSAAAAAAISRPARRAAGAPWRAWAREPPEPARRDHHPISSRRLNSWGSDPAPFAPIERDLGPAIAAVWALCESTFEDAYVMDWTQEQAILEIAARLQMVGLGQTQAERG